jgi:hypothetical protein
VGQVVEADVFDRAFFRGEEPVHQDDDRGGAADCRGARLK